MTIITLLTDFGLLDGYPGIMKGVIYSIAPSARIADITHLISPQNVREGAVALARSFAYFPPDSIHVAVVDPGVGTQRRPVAMRLGKYFFVGPDNGLFSLVIAEANQHGWECQMVELNKPEYWLPAPSSVFHGRDIFAPVAAHLARGIRLDQLGEPITYPCLLSYPQPVRTAEGWTGEVVAVDHFGNLSTNILDTHLVGSTPPVIGIAGKTIHGLVKTFGDRPAGELVALIGTDHDLSISIVNGNAQSELGVSVGDQISVYFQ
jgi:hypothetical protein